MNQVDIKLISWSNKMFQGHKYLPVTNKDDITNDHIIECYQIKGLNSVKCALMAFMYRTRTHLRFPTICLKKNGINGAMITYRYIGFNQQ